MSERRNIFLHGLAITLRRFPALLWTYIFNLGLALIFSIRFHAQFASILDHSLAAQRLVNGFDLTAVAGASFRFQDAPGGAHTDSYGAIPLFFILYFLLVPGTLFCYQTSTPARLSTLFHQGLLHFWRFIRITILTLLISGIILGLLSFLQGKWAEHVDNHAVGLHSFLARMTGVVIIALVACFLRLYFDLVEVYTVQLGLHIRSNGKSDRRVRRTLGPAWRILRAEFAEVYPIFLFLAILGAAAVLLTARISVHMLAQPRVWPMFLLTQIGLFLMLFTRFWQRGVETSLALQHPIYPPPQLPIRPVVTRVSPPPAAPFVPPLDRPLGQQTVVQPLDRPVEPPLTSRVEHPFAQPVDDPIPDPEPASPSLDEPDLGIFHRNPDKPSQ
jgi:hypothetical protein